MRNRPLILIVQLLIVGLASSSASAFTLGFSCITYNSAPDCASGEAQLSVDVTDLGSGQVLFDFMNAGPDASSITDIYFDDGTLLGIAGLVDADDNALGYYGDAGVDFSPGASPGNLPGGNTIGFVTTTDFLADSDPAVQPNGVNPGEMLEIVFNLQPLGTFADVLSELASGELRIGIHVQGFSGGGSESFVNVPAPEPGTAILMGLGLTALSARRRWTSRRA
jgi:hypothetical protein